MQNLDQFVANKDSNNYNIDGVLGGCFSTTVELCHKILLLYVSSGNHVYLVVVFSQLLNFVARFCYYMFPLITMKLLTSRFFCIALRIVFYGLYLAGGYLITLSFKNPPSYFDSLLFAIVTVSTIGYGDVTPDTYLAKALVVAFLLMGTVISTFCGNPVRDLVDAIGDKLEKLFFQSIKITSGKTKQILKSIFAIVWILFVVGTGVTGILIFEWDAMKINRDTGDNATDFSRVGINATNLFEAGVNATYFSVVSAYTVGYGDFHFSATAGKVFALVWLPLGTSIVGSAVSYLCGHRSGICPVCIWKDKKTIKSMMEDKIRLVSAKKFKSGDLVEGKATLRKHCHELTNAESSLKFLSSILSSRIYKFVPRQGLEPAHKCSRVFSSSQGKVNILMKREDCFPKKLGSSYRWRGIYNFMANAQMSEMQREFICTVGKHAVTVARVAKLLNSEATVAIPIDYEQADWKKIEEDITKAQCSKDFHGTCIQESDDYAKKVAKDKGMTYVPSCDHTDIITGYGTIGAEIITQMVRDGRIDNLHAIFVPIGDGNLIAGIAAYVKRVFPKVKIFGVEECTSCVMAWSFDKGQRVFFEKQNGEVIEAIGAECFSICAQYIDGIIIVDHDAIAIAKQHMIFDTITNGSALCIAGVQRYCTDHSGRVRNKTIVAVIDE